MKAKIVGVSLSSGVFVPDTGTGEAIPYDNICFHCVTDGDKMLAGEQVRILKLKRSHFDAMKGDIKAPQPIEKDEHLRQLVGHECRIYMDGKYIDEIYYMK